MTKIEQRNFIFIIGTRAQLIKMAPVIATAERKLISCTLLMTGQHEETMQDLLDEFGITSRQIKALPASERSTVLALFRWLPAAYFGVKRQLERLTADVDCPIVLVHGDTLSAALGAFVARRCMVKVVHLESGLTSGKLFDPFPEEIFRRVVFRYTDIAMCPNARAAEHMRKYSCAKVVNTQGNTIEDAVILTGALTLRQQRPSIAYLLVSLHRFQNLYKRQRLRKLVDLLVDLARNFTLYFVLHPTTRGRLAREGFLKELEQSSNIKLMPRMGYRDFLHLAAGATCVLTDGGSNQEELATLGVPTIIMRAHTERPDGLGTNAIMEKDVPDDIITFLVEGRHRNLAQPPRNLDVNGPSYRIVRELLEFLV